ncbi:glycosyltransferase family 2 protein [Sulfurihydrogenibium sp.]|jgi:glycosyltransferase involved in cell wall biosynthesis|uniref:glycosyltransferase family 2 protein n=1 Tax=Sulfurihydrogenibium sp. TaxID=2053621 RepID=UPI00262D3C63|nr:glycosyltransferase family 2 protein [Sulfurihydrogenibium sp.]
MSKKDLVSVIMPNYNRAKYISEAIESVISQTYPIWELMIIDDCSTDNSVNIIEEYVAKDERIKLIRLPKNSGPAIARNTGIEVASGRYIAFLDSDDVWLPYKLEKQVKFMRENNLSLVYSAYYIIDKYGFVKGIRNIKEKISYKDLLKTNWIGNLTGIYDAQKLGKVFMENVGHEDYVLWLSILKRIDYAFGINEPLAKYRVLPNSYSSNKFKSIKSMWNIYRSIERLDLLHSIYYLGNYIYYGIKKRFRELPLLIDRDL